jgi:hypothetical protein
MSTLPTQLGILLIVYSIVLTKEGHKEHLMSAKYSLIIGKVLIDNMAQNSSYQDVLANCITDKSTTSNSLKK